MIEILVFNDNIWSDQNPMTTVSQPQDVQTRFSLQLAFAKFLSKLKGIFNTVPVSWIQHSLRNFLLLNLDRNLAKANDTGNHICTSCDAVVLAKTTNLNENWNMYSLKAVLFHDRIINFGFFIYKKV